jgi:predicted unusual protein kinase regulating ubiquinone biosynthesis (AarF/ABC1/UbiB family)
MNPFGPRRPQRSDAERQRRSQVEDCLARWALLGRPRRLQAVPEAGLSEAGLGARLRGALTELGPPFSAFGLYLASRIDLLAAIDALELAALPGWVSPLPIDAFRERVAAELGRPSGELYAVLEAEPFESRLLLQSHRGRLASGEPVIVRLVRTDAEEEIQANLELLPLIGEALVAQGWTAAAAREVLADFRQSLREQVDLQAALQDLDLLAVDAEVFGRLVAPAVCRELTTARLITTADLGGLSFGIAVPDLRQPWGPAVDPRELVRSLCTVWLRQALAGRVFPVEVRAEDVRVLPDGRLGFQGVAFSRPPAAAQADLQEVVMAIAFRDPDAAGSALLREMVREDGANSMEQLRTHLRQLVPFRDGSWSPSGESLAEHLFLYARTARACGYRPRRPLLEFCRGLFAVGLAGRRLAPAHDPLFEGLQDFRMLTGVSQVRDAMSFGNWGGQLDRYALLMAALPQRLDEMLTLAAEGGARPAPPDTVRPSRRAESSHLVLAAALMVLAALALLLHHFVQVGALAGWGETIAAVLFLTVGSLLLWILTRTG